MKVMSLILCAVIAACESRVQVQPPASSRHEPVVPPITPERVQVLIAEFKASRQQLWLIAVPVDAPAQALVLGSFDMGKQTDLQPWEVEHRIVDSPSAPIGVVPPVSNWKATRIRTDSKALDGAQTAPNLCRVSRSELGFHTERTTLDGVGEYTADYAWRDGETGTVYIAGARWYDGFENYPAPGPSRALQQVRWRMREAATAETSDRSTRLTVCADITQELLDRAASARR